MTVIARDLVEKAGRAIWATQARANPYECFPDIWNGQAEAALEAANYQGAVDALRDLRQALADLADDIESDGLDEAADAVRTLALTKPRGQ